MCYKFIRREVTNALDVWIQSLIQFHGALREGNAHITVYDVTTWRWVNLVSPAPPSFPSLAVRKGLTKFTTFGAHDVIAITSPQKNDRCTEELREHEPASC